ncbi:MAG: aspartate-semialdehyde dehydrogenase [Bacteroidales bacterium]
MRQGVYLNCPSIHKIVFYKKNSKENENCRCWSHGFSGFRYAKSDYTVVSVEDAIAAHPQIAIFSAGGSTSLKYAPEFAKVGCTVIDNSSAWRMDTKVPLIVPEINAQILTKNDKIIANPNCSTIQMVVALAPIHATYGIERLVISTYQSVSGTGVKAVQQLEDETQGIQDGVKVYPYPIHRNLFPHGGDFLADGYTTEELKLEQETHKILNDPNIRVTSTVVRVPVTGGHSEAINIETKKDFEIEDIRKLLNHSRGLRLLDDPSRNIYPMPLYSEGRNEVFVGRIRRDHSLPHALNIWVVADNIRKGAATNAVQIAAYLIDHQLV